MILLNPPPMNQLHNFEVANNLSALTESILLATKESFSESTLAALRESAEVCLWSIVVSSNLYVQKTLFKSTRKLFNLILEPLFVNLMQAVAEAVARMHREDLSGYAFMSLQYSGILCDFKEHYRIERHQLAVKCAQASMLANWRAL